MSSWLTTVVDKAAGILSRRGTRRSFLAGTAVVGSAIVVSPKRYLMEPISAIAAICGPGATASGGYTAFCCSIYRGENKCPAGTFVGGWWRADGSSYCCSGGQPGLAVLHRLPGRLQGLLERLRPVLLAELLELPATRCHRKL